MQTKVNVCVCVGVRACVRPYGSVCVCVYSCVRSCLYAGFDPLQLYVSNVTPFHCKTLRIFH